MDVDQVAEVLRNAAKAVADLPKDLQPAAFERAVDLLSGTGGKKQSLQEDGKGEKQDKKQDKKQVDNSATDDPLGKVAAKLKVARDLVDEVYSAQGDEVTLVISPSKLDKTKSGGAKQIALLVAAAHQAQGEEWTPTEKIRAVADDFSKYDVANFSVHMKALDDEFRFRGSGAKREVKLSRRGWEDAAALVTSLAGGE